MRLKAIRRVLQRHRLMRVRIIVSADWGTGLPEVIIPNLEGALGKRYRVNVTEMSYSQQVLDAAKRETIDLFLPVLNNMRMNDTLPYEANSRAEAALHVAAYLHKTYRIPFIALAGFWPEEWDVAQKTKEAGGSAFFVVPVSGEQLIEAVEDCLETKASLRTNYRELQNVG